MVNLLFAVFSTTVVHGQTTESTPTSSAIVQPYFTFGGSVVLSQIKPDLDGIVVATPYQLGVGIRARKLDIQISASMGSASLATINNSSIGEDLSMVYIFDLSAGYVLYEDEILEWTPQIGFQGINFNKPVNNGNETLNGVNSINLGFTTQTHTTKHVGVFLTTKYGFGFDSNASSNIFINGVTILAGIRVGILSPE